MQHRRQAGTSFELYGHREGAHEQACLEVKQTLSAPSVKWLFRLRAIGGVIGAGMALWILSGLNAPSEIRPWPYVLDAVIVLLVGGLIVKDRFTRRDLKRVEVDDGFLYVSEYAGPSQAAIPLNDIVSVTQWRGRTLRPVSVYLRSPSTFGTRIRFQPKRGWGWAITEDSVVGELRKRANLPKNPNA